MAKQFSTLERIENNEVITDTNHYEFIYKLQNALLLALCEQGSLNTMQYRQAEESLKRKRLDRAKNLMERGAM